MTDTPTPAPIHAISLRQLEDASTIAEQLATQFEEVPSLRDAFEKYATLEAQEQVARFKREILKSLFAAATAETKEEELHFIKKGFNAIIKSADIMTSAVSKGDPRFEAEIDAFFVQQKSLPRLGADYTQVFEEAGAPVLAAASRKAHAPKP